jgi:ATP-dependent helicase HrpB
VRRAADALERLAGRLAPPVQPGASHEERLARAVLAGFPDRVARRREPGSPRLLLAGGTGAVLGRESGVRGGEWLVALDVEAAGRTTAAEARVRAASRIDRAWLRPTRRSIDHTLDAGSGAVRAVERDWYGALVLGERPVPPDASEAEGLLAAAIRARARTDDEIALLRRLRFAGIAWDEDAWIAAACRGKRSLAAVDLLAAAPRDLDRLAPTSIPVPSGRRARLEYKEDGSVTAAVKLQELFGLAETPRIGPRREPVTFELLAPSGRPVQTTRDLAGFWTRVYPAVRKELRGRYPRHPWPEDPWTAVPTHRPKPRRR